MHRGHYNLLSGYNRPQHQKQRLLARLIQLVTPSAVRFSSNQVCTGLIRIKHSRLLLLFTSLPASPLISVSPVQLGLLELFLLLTLSLSHTHSLFLCPPLSFYSLLCLFAGQLYKPASLLLFLHTDRAIFSRHLISVGHSRSRLSGPFSLRL